jgi:hypothetical protein
MFKEIIKAAAIAVISGLVINLVINKLKQWRSKRELKDKQNKARQRIADIRKDILVGKDIPKYVPDFYLECKKILPSYDVELQYLKHLNNSLVKKPAAKRKSAAKKKPAAKRKPAAKKRPAARKVPARK